MIGTVSGAIFYGTTKGLGLLGISATASTIVTPAFGIVVIGGIGYGFLKVIAADEACRKNNKSAIETAWQVYASYHNKELADSYKKSNSCSRFLSIARRKTRKILGEIQRKKITQERYEQEKKFIEENYSSDTSKKKKYFRRLSRKYPEEKREINKKEKRFLAALEEIQKRPDTSNGIREAFARLKKKYQCSSGQYLAELACGEVTAYASMATGLLTGGSIASVVLRKIAKKKANGTEIEIGKRAINNYVKGQIGENTNQAFGVIEERTDSVRKLFPGIFAGTLLRKKYQSSHHKKKEVPNKKNN